MKSFRTTLYLAAGILLLVGYAVFDSKREVKKAEELAAKEKFVSFQPSVVTALKIERGDESVEIKKIEEKWEMIRPLADTLESETVIAYLESIAGGKGSEMPAPKDGSYKWDQYFLSEPGASIELLQGEQALVKISISKRAAFDGSYYLRMGEKLFLGDQAWAGVLEKGASHLRDKRLWRDRKSVKEIRLAINTPDLNEKFALKSQNGGWAFEKSPNPVDVKKVETYLDSLKNIRASTIIGDPADERALREFKLGLPSLVLQLDGYTARIWQAKDEKFYARTSESHALMPLTKWDFDQILMSSGEFRDGTAPFKFPVEQVGQLRLTSNSKTRTIVKKEGGWTLEKAEEGEKLNEPLMQRIFEKTSNMEAKAYFPLDQKIGKIDHVVEFLSKDGKSFLKMEMADQTTPTKGRLQGQSLTFVKVRAAQSERPGVETLGVLTSDIDGLELEKVVEKAPEPDPPQQSEKK